jgi:hypothetical protein
VAGLGLARQAGPGWARPGAVWLAGAARPGAAGQGAVWLAGMARRGGAGRGKARHGKAGEAWLGEAWRGVARFGWQAFRRPVTRGNPITDRLFCWLDAYLIMSYPYMVSRCGQAG